MTNKEAIERLLYIKHKLVSEEHGKALDLAIKALEEDIDAYEQGYTDGWKERYGEPEERTQGEWVPITYRPMTKEEEKELCVKWGIKEGSLEDWEKRAFTCSLPDDGQEILISVGRYVHEDICSWNEDCCGLENNGDWDGVDAWMPKPEPYKKEGEQ